MTEMFYSEYQPISVDQDCGMSSVLVLKMVCIKRGLEFRSLNNVNKVDSSFQHPNWFDQNCFMSSGLVIGIVRILSGCKFICLSNGHQVDTLNSTYKLLSPRMWYPVF